MNGEWVYVSGPNSSLGRTLNPGPSLRQDIPRPPLRYLALRTRRRIKLSWKHSHGRWHAARRDLSLRARASAARATAHVVARLDEHIWQPAMWPFRPAQREMLARTMAALSVAIVAVGWVAAYSALAPAPAARPPAPPPAPPKPIAERVVPRALPRVEAPIVEVRLPIPAPHRR